ncbi:MAG TPA: DUF86 domain-containing protein [Nitrosomonas europaea]|uniref:type VII toxin-antitoxin system HepT family RNase toxin n=1 Tax=Nitrosomonas europaea TaxID=915 RepID=UPI002491B3A1|nr:DUF86 domain-containing protein [Nitrosomonas europaea]HRN80903.1 DUF86 domain-containing protein [Nitrosomonas europaea]HRO55225.1 DUF86 domain-containing protein [Nitrosomonas europaea]HRQ07521.1 DUF86 domain-containing protein [Nitrosomonas europaea]HUM72753.1 DUF86 domain-containing protein [Nitrosomonas europaea]
MDRLILAGKLESLRRCIKRIEDRKPANVDYLIQDADRQDILVLNLARAVQLSVDIGSHLISNTDQATPQTMGEVFTTLNEIGAVSAETCEQLKKAVGFRNIAVHNYEAINWEIVYTICERSPADFRRFTQEICQYADL